MLGRRPARSYAVPQQNTARKKPRNYAPILRCLAPGSTIVHNGYGGTGKLPASICPLGVGARRSTASDARRDRVAAMHMFAIGLAALSTMAARRRSPSRLANVARCLTSTCPSRQGRSLRDNAAVRAW